MLPSTRCCEVSNICTNFFVSISASFSFTISLAEEGNLQYTFKARSESVRSLVIISMKTSQALRRPARGLETSSIWGARRMQKNLPLRARHILDPELCNHFLGRTAPWELMGTYGNPWEPMGTHGNPWEPSVLCPNLVCFVFSFRLP